MNNDSNNKNRNQSNNSGGNVPPTRTIITLVIVALIFTVVINTVYDTFSKASQKEISYTEFQQKLDAGELDSVEFQKDRILILTKTEAAKSASSQIIYYTGLIPNLDLNSLMSDLSAHKVDASGQIVEEVSPVVSFLVSWVLPIAVMYLLFSLLMRGMSKRMGGMGGLGGIGQSNAKVYMEKQTGVTFKDVAGQDEAKESLQEIIDFLHNPQKYAAIGAKLPKGALLVGSPGTGKTDRKSVV